MRDDTDKAEVRDYLDALDTFRELQRLHGVCTCARCLAWQDTVHERSERVRALAEVTR